MSMMRELVRFYGNDTAVTEDEMKLASAAKGLSEEREATSAMANAEDRVDIQEHIRRFHGGKLEPGESCPFLDKLHKAEEDFGTLDPKDADGDGNSDFPEEEETEEGMNAEVSEDSAVDQYLRGIESASVTEEPNSEHCDSCGSATEHFVRGISKKYPNASFIEFRKHNLPFYRIVIEGKEYIPAITRDFSDRYRVYDSDGKELFRCNFPDTAEKMASYGEGFSETLKMEGDSAWTDNGIKSRMRNVVARKNPDFDDAAIEEYIASLEK